jgi:hypothetical protein
MLLIVLVASSMSVTLRLVELLSGSCWDVTIIGCCLSIPILNTRDRDEVSVYLSGVFINCSLPFTFTCPLPWTLMVVCGASSRCFKLWICILAILLVAV